MASFCRHFHRHPPCFRFTSYRSFERSYVNLVKSRSCNARSTAAKTTQIRRLSQSHIASELGLRSNYPPDSEPTPEPNENNDGEISDKEWDIRTGRAIFLLQQTLPEFFDAGLVTSAEQASKLSSGALLSLSTLTTGEPDSIYSPKIRLAYTPPVALPAPFPRTLHVEGLPLYMASTVFVRHTLNALYADLHVTLTRFVVQSQKSPALDTGTDTARDSKAHDAGKAREKVVLVGFRVSGTARVSGGTGEWDVASTYSFSRRTGLINSHTINSIYPAPHQAVYDALRASLVKVLGLSKESIGSQVGAACGGANRINIVNDPALRN
jgi:hypothetical protein